MTIQTEIERAITPATAHEAAPEDMVEAVTRALAEAAAAAEAETREEILGEAPSIVSVEAEFPSEARTFAPEAAPEDMVEAVTRALSEAAAAAEAETREEILGEAPSIVSGEAEFSGEVHFETEASAETPNTHSAAEPAPEPQVAPVFIVCSPRPRVGKTLVARLVLDFHLYTGRPVLPYDANPNDLALSEFFESDPVSVLDTRGQMELFDQLVVADGIAKVVDVAAEQFDAFFDVMEKIDFAGEAEKAGIPVVVLYLADDHFRSADAYRNLADRFPGITLVPVHNELTESYADETVPHPPVSAAPIHIEPLPPYLDGVVRRRGFSFAHHLRDSSDQPTQLDRWAARPFVALHHLQLSLSLNELAPHLKEAA